MDFKRIISVLGDDRGKVLSARELRAATGYELLGSGSCDWDGGSTTITIPVAYSGMPKLFGLIADEAIADTAQAMSFCKLIDGEVYPEEFVPPDEKVGMIKAWGLSAAGVTMHNFVSTEQAALSSSQMSCTQFSASYPWKANTYKWYVWGSPD